MTSEIRANTSKNRVGLGTISFTNTGPVVSGIITATGADINGDLDVDGHTNLDNVSIVGVTTFNGLSTNDVIRVKSLDSNGISKINILSEGTTGSSRILFSDTAATTGDAWINYSHNDRAITFTTAGTGNERLRIAANGTIGIGGTTIPGGLLDLSSAVPSILFSETGVSANNGKWLNAANGSELYWQAQTDAHSGGGNLFKMTRSAQQIQSFEGQQSGVTWFTIRNSDKTVGIGTNSPGTNHNLEILGNASAYATLNVKSQSLSHGSALELGAVDDDDYGSIVQFASGSGEGGRMRFTAGGQETMNLRGGVVLVKGTSAIGSGTGLEVTYNGSSNHGRVLAQGFIARDNYGAPTNAGNSMYSPAANTLAFSTNSGERLRIDSNGDINLGNNPTNQYGYKLNIQDSAIIYAQTASSGGLEAKWHLDNSAQLMELGTVTTDDLALVTNNVSRLRITSDGTTISTISSPDPYNTVKENIRIVNGAGNQGAGSKIRFATGNANAHIESRITGGNSNSGTSLNFATSPANSDAEECLRITPSGNILQRSRPYSNTHQNPGWGMGRYVKSGWLMAQSSFSNPVMDLVDLLDQGNAYQNIFFKVTAMQIRFRGHNNPEGQIHTGYASAKRDPSGTNTWYAYVGTMVLENAASGFNSGSNVGTLSWSASNNFDTATLRYTGNRQDNYDTYQVCVEVWSNNNDSLGFKLSSGYLA